MELTSGFNFPFVTSTPFSICFAVNVETTHPKRMLSLLHFLMWWAGQSNFSNYFSWSYLKMEDLQLSTLYIFVFFFSKTRKSMNMPISTSKKEHLFPRIKGCFFIINVSQTKTLVFFSILDESHWFKNNRQIYLEYVVLYIYIYIYI